MSTLTAWARELTHAHRHTAAHSYRSTTAESVWARRFIKGTQ